MPPSPTGYFHVGNARTALFNYLLAKKHGGDFIVRIEDTDRERFRKEFEEDILDSMEWLGIRPDEGPRQGGPHAPYRQSERTATYRAAIEKLLNSGRAFYCAHAEDELEAEKKALMADGKNPVHKCAYRHKPAGDGPPDMNAVIRFKTPEGSKLTFSDLIRGEISFESNLLGDFSIARATREVQPLGLSPLYNLAVVVDDAAMEVSHVIRGEDHISNTPKQMLILEALGLPQPAYAHLPIVLGPDRSKLSKRHGATSIRDYRQEGYLPETMVNFMALLGWNPGDEREIFSMDELIREFSLERVQKSGAVFDTKKLDWLNGEYIRRKTTAELAGLCRPYLEEKFSISPPSPRLQRAGNFQFSKDYIEKVIALEQPRLKKLSEIGERVDYFFREPDYDAKLLRWKEMGHQALKESLRQSEAVIKSIHFPATKEEIEKKFLAAIGAGDKGNLLWPLRAALTGKKASPGPFEIAAILGRDTILKRLKGALQKLGEN